MSIKIISGRFKGIALEVPKSARATLGRARQSLFDILEASEIDREIGHFFEDKTILDCFAGSGAVGIEGLSRGATHAYFVDVNSDAVRTIHSNLMKIAKGINGDSETCFSTVKRSDISKIKSCSETEGCDFISMDPPFNSAINLNMVLKHLSNKGWIGEKSVIVIESDASNGSMRISKEFEGLKLLMERKIGRILLQIFAASAD